MFRREFCFLTISNRFKTEEGGKGILYITILEGQNAGEAVIGLVINSSIFFY